MEAEVNPGVVEHKWKSTKINEFIKKSKNVVDALFETVNKMKHSIEAIE